MKKYATLFLLLLFGINLYAPPNCEVYKADDSCYKSCKQAWRAIRYKQGSYQSQQYFDRSIDLCEGFAYSHMEKAVPYLKRGLFIEWKKLIDRAVELDPQEYLGYRGWCRLQFLRDYEGTIQDIEQLKSLVKYDIGYCQTGDYHLNIVLALCYRELGQVEKARQLYLEHINSENYVTSLYDYYHLGVLEYESGNYQLALNYLDQQITINGDLGETYYFKALAHKALGQTDLYTKNISIAEQHYINGKMRTDSYTETIDKIYLSEILAEREKAFQ